MCELFIKAETDLWESSTRSLRIDRMVKAGLLLDIAGIFMIVAVEGGMAGLV